MIRLLKLRRCWPVTDPQEWEATFFAVEAGPNYRKGEMFSGRGNSKRAAMRDARECFREMTRLRREQS